MNDWHESESAAIQAWIDGLFIPCKNCPGYLAREAGQWFHEYANPFDCPSPEPKVLP